MRELEEDIACAIRSDVSVLVTGEPGVGKKFVGRLIHQKSRRRGPFIIADCGDLVASLGGSGGSAQAAFDATSPGTPGHNMMNAARTGTLLIEQIEKLSWPMQTELLRFIGTEVPGSSVRLMTVTSTDLYERVSFDAFRADLFYRLNVIQLKVPALRDRPEDIPIILRHYLSCYRRVEVPQLSTAAWQRLIEYPWPENMPELKNVAARLTAQDLARPFEPEDLPPEIGS